MIYIYILYIHILYNNIFYIIYIICIYIYIYICWFHQHQREFLVTIPLQAMVRYLQQHRFFQMRTGCESCWAFNNHSMDWLNGKLTGKPYFIGETIWFPVSIFLSTSPVNHTMFKTGLAGNSPFTKWRFSSQIHRTDGCSSLPRLITGWFIHE